jgi:hypothetical protein
MISPTLILHSPPLSPPTRPPSAVVGHQTDRDGMRTLNPCPNELFTVSRGNELYG